MVGEAQIESCTRAVAEDGVISAVGGLEGNSSGSKEVGNRLVRIVVGNCEQHEAMLAFCALRGMGPVVDATFGLESLPDALRLTESATKMSGMFSRGIAHRL